MEDDIILPEGFEMPQPEGTEPVVETQEQTEPETVEPGEDTTPPDTTEQPEVTEPQKIRVKFNHEEKELTVEEAAQLAQKGMNYEKAVERARQEAAQQARDAVIAEMGYTWNGKPITTESEYKQALAEQELINKYKDRELPEEVIKELIENRRFREESMKEKQTKETQAKEQAQFAEFFEYFQDANGRAFDPAKDSIPAEVQEAVSKGVPLKFAYMEHHNKELRNRIKIETQNKANKAKAPVGGVTVNGGTPPTSEDLFLKGFNSL